MDLKVVVVVALALGMGFVASESNINEKVPEIDKVIYDTSSEKNNCPSNLSSHLDNNLQSMKVNSDLKRSDYKINVKGLNNLKASDNYEFICRDGYDEGENVNYRYCEPHTFGNLQYENIDESGNIVEQKSLSLQQFVLDSHNNVVNVKCENRDKLE